MLETTFFRGTLVNIYGIGVLIQGAPESGKSLAALSLMKHGHRFVADEVVLITNHGQGKLRGQPVEKDPRIEVRGLGIFRASDLFKDSVMEIGPIDMVVELAPYITRRDLGRQEPLVSKVEILNCELQKYFAPVPKAMDPGLLVELAVRVHYPQILEKNWEDVR